MKTLRLVNFLIAILGMAGGFCLFFIKSIDFSSISISGFLFIMFSLFGVEKIIDKEKKLGFTYVLTSLVVFSGFLMEVIRG